MEKEYPYNKDFTACKCMPVYLDDRPPIDKLKTHKNLMELIQKGYVFWPRGGGKNWLYKNCFNKPQKEVNMLDFETKVTDRITGFTGTIAGRLEYLNGCIQYLVIPKMKKTDKERPEGSWIDEQYLEVRGEKVKGFATTGGDTPAPKSYHP